MSRSEHTHKFTQNSTPREFPWARGGRKTTAVLVMCLLGLLSLTVSIPASAFSTDALASPAEASQDVVTNPDCVHQVSEAIKLGAKDISLDICTSTVTLTASQGLKVTAVELIEAKKSMSSKDYASLITAAASGAIYYKDYSQSMNNITDKETQYGKFYYNGTRAWVTVAYAGLKGTHYCKVDWAIGYGVDLRGCNEDGTNSTRNLHQHWHFAVFTSGFPLGWDEIYTIHVNRAGSIWQ